MRFVDDIDRETHWYNRNYLFAGTILIIIANIVLYWAMGTIWQKELIDTTAKWEDFSFINLMTIFFTAFSHLNWQHVLLNMLCFAFVGFYLERRYGTFALLFLVTIFAFTAPAMATHVRGNTNHCGFSGVIFATYAYVFIDFIFFLIRREKNITNLIIGIIVVLYSYIAMSCVSGDTGLVFKWWPYDLVHNMAHYTGFLIGILVALFFQFTKGFKKRNS